MQAFEYKVVPAPHKGTKAKGIKTPESRFANSVEMILNEMASEGWEYQRAELLPSEERSGLTGSTTNWRNVLVFRRALAPATTQAAPQPLAEAAAPQGAAPAVATPVAATDTPVNTAPVLTATAGDPEAPENATLVPGLGAAKMQADDGVEELSPVSGMTTALKARAERRTADET
ncbi:DUF4177 domain-containing protein [Pseudophaeobacter flagellatus]|uniref:DUF4177 domain-containing protein n=1 Tax=Pseudophaeobacter flagellatus TaxID=2899119 RepID=UPI001E282980|nr:DUF4177 domain-containing protein [Pseudophaeobacter flagellatus]MCD9146379.1 DUF4177 domain-containing protein [Pseudophaeobacter flagellatus]